MIRLIERLTAAGFGIIVALYIIWLAVVDIASGTSNAGGAMVGGAMALALLCFCLYKAVIYVIALHRGPRTAHAMVWRYAQVHGTDSDGDPTTDTIHSLRLDDGEIIHVPSIRIESLHDGMTMRRFTTPGEHVIITWYEKPFICTSVTLDPERPVRATPEERHRILNPNWTPGNTTSTTSTASVVGNGTNSPDDGSWIDTDNLAPSDGPKPTIKDLAPTAFRTLNYVLTTITGVLIAAVAFTSSRLGQYGIQSVIKGLLIGLILAWFALWVFIHMVVKQVLMHRAVTDPNFRARDGHESMYLPQEQVDSEQRRSLIHHLLGVIALSILPAFALSQSVGALIEGPQTVPVTYQGVERRVEEGDDSVNIYADFQFRTENDKTITITTDWDERATIEQQVGEESGRHLLLTYWTDNGSVPTFDNAKPDPKYE